MGRVTRGTLLATLKELKKLPRPKSSSTACVAVQAICPKQRSSNTTVNKTVITQRRNCLLSQKGTSPINYDLLAKSEMEYEQFIKDYRTAKTAKSYVVEK